jgi:hypothetical protein
MIRREYKFHFDKNQTGFVAQDSHKRVERVMEEEKESEKGTQRPRAVKVRSVRDGDLEFLKGNSFEWFSN